MNTAQKWLFGTFGTAIVIALTFIFMPFNFFEHYQPVIILTILVLGFIGTIFFGRRAKKKKK